MGRSDGDHAEDRAALRQHALASLIAAGLLAWGALTPLSAEMADALADVTPGVIDSVELSMLDF